MMYVSEKEQIYARLAKWVYGEMKVRGMSQEEVSHKLGISRQAFGQKLKKKSFNYNDFVFFVKEFKPTDKELREIIGL